LEPHLLGPPGSQHIFIFIEFKERGTVSDKLPYNDTEGEDVTFFVELGVSTLEHLKSNPPQLIINGELLLAYFALHSPFEKAEDFGMAIVSEEDVSTPQVLMDDAYFIGKSYTQHNL